MKAPSERQVRGGVGNAEDGGGGMRVAIAEDSVLLLAGLQRLLAAEGHQVATYPTADALVQALSGPQAPVDLVITDVRMPPTNTDEGLRAAVHLRALHPALPIVVLSQYVERSYAVELFSGDVRGLGYVLKDRVADIDDFLATVATVAAGGTVIDPEVVAQLLARTRPSGLDKLTGREHEVLALMAEGRSNTAIAERMVITVPGVEKHVSSIFVKLALQPAPDDHRRVLAVLRYLEHQGES